MPAAPGLGSRPLPSRRRLRRRTRGHHMSHASRRALLSIVAAVALLGAAAARAQGPAGSPAQAAAPGTPPLDRQALVEDLVAASRILADLGVVDGYGHV